MVLVMVGQLQTWLTMVEQRVLVIDDQVKCFRYQNSQRFWHSVFIVYSFVDSCPLISLHGARQAVTTVR